MRLRFVVGVLAVVSGLCLAAAQARLSEDPRLQKTISLWLRMEPLSAALQAISQETGVQLSVESTAPRDKVALFVENRPAHEILERLATLFRYEWRTDGRDGYVLRVPDATRTQESQAARALRDAQQTALRDLRRAAQEVWRMTLQQYQQRKDELSKKPLRQLSPYERQLKRVLDSPMTPQSLRSATADEPPLETIVHDSSRALLECLALMPEEAFRALLNGQTVGLSTRPLRGVYPMPSEVLAPREVRERRRLYNDPDRRLSYTTEIAPTNPAWLGVWIRQSPGRPDGLEYEFYGVAPTPTSAHVILLSPSGKPSSEPKAYTLYRSFSAFYYETRAYIEQHSWAQAWAAWATPESELKARLPEPPAVRRRAEPPIRAYYHIDDPYPNPIYVSVTAADVAEWFAWLTGVPVIADAFRASVLSIRHTHLRDAHALLPYLRANFWARLDEAGYLLMRTQRYWERRPLEFSEEALRPLERKFKAGGWLELSDYADLAARMTPEQANFFLETAAFNWLPAAEFPVRPLSDASPALRFWASLNALQRRQALSGEWLPIDGLTPTQRQRFWSATQERFPPVNQLIAELPAEYDTNYSGIMPHHSRYDSALEPPPVEPPPYPAFRVVTIPERYSRILAVSPNGILVQFDDPDRHTAVRVSDEFIRAARQSIASQLKAQPNARLYRLRASGYEFQFTDGAGDVSRYFVEQGRYEPFELPKAWME